MKNFILTTIFCSFSLFYVSNAFAIAQDSEKLDGHDSTEFATRPNNVVVVAKGFGSYTTGNLFAPGFGQYTTIGSALNAITPTVDKPYLIKVMPGTYKESVYMKSNVHLQGSGPEITTIEIASTGEGIKLDQVSNVRVTGFTVKGAAGSYNTCGIWDLGSSATIENNVITNHRWPAYFEQSSTSTIKNNTISDTSGNGIEALDSSITIENNNILDSSSDGITLVNSSAVISGNRLTGNAQGIYVDSDSTSKIIGNEITGGGVGVYMYGTSVVTNNRVYDHVYEDLELDDMDGVINFNMVDKISSIGSASYVGCYNVKSTGETLPCYPQ